jgi:3-oxoacyl-[acyl-carrier protein] reductase
MNEKSNFLVLGATGTIGLACAEKLKVRGTVVMGSKDLSELAEQINSVPNFSGVVWAQGMNIADSAFNFDSDKYQCLMEANVVFIMSSLSLLLKAGSLGHASQLVVLSSIWSQASRPNKLSYGVSKAAVGGLIRSLAVDLGPMGIHINSVSPGPINSPMTSSLLNLEELERVVSESPLKRLVTLDEVASTVCELVTGKLSGVTGQEIVIDGGWSVSKLV